MPGIQITFTNKAERESVTDDDLEALAAILPQRDRNARQIVAGFIVLNEAADIYRPIVVRVSNNNSISIAVPARNIMG